MCLCRSWLQVRPPFLSEEEKQVILQMREYKKEKERKSNYQLHILKTAYEYDAWLKSNGMGDSFSTFCDEFSYDGENRPQVHRAISDIREIAIGVAT